MTDLIEEIDWDGNILAIHPITKLKERMFIHKASLIIPKANNEKFIFAKRAPNKFPYPNTWTCGIGGKVNANETTEDAAKREAMEEAGLETEIDFISSFKYDGDSYKAVFSLFTTKNPVSISQLNLDKNEISFMQEMTIKEMDDIVKNRPNDCAPTFIYAFNALKSSLNK